MKKVHHVGYLVKNITKSEEAFLKLGYKIVKDAIYDEIRQSFISFISLENEVIELIQPTIKSDLYTLLKKYQNCPYHICYEVDNISDEILRLKKEGFLLFKDEEQAPAISEDAKVAFLIHSRVGMIELVEKGDLK